MLKEKLKLLPDSSGCYLMKNSANDIIYVGKAKSLFNRVNSYFRGAHDLKTTRLVKDICDFDFILTNNEKEALILENNLIKKHRPIYNILLMDDKSYPYLKISNEKYPTLTVVRELKKDKKATYFGPYASAYAANQIAKIINELFPTKKCRQLPKKVCLYYHLGQCLGMCEYKIDDLVYQKMIEDITKLLKSQHKELSKLLTDKMQLAAKSENYEVAKIYRDYMMALEHISETQGVEYSNLGDCDVLNYFISHGFIAFQVLMLRDNKLLDKIVKVYPFYGNLQDDFETFYMQYREVALVSEKVIVPYDIDINNLEFVLKYKKSKYDNLLALAKKNAQQAIYQKVDLGNVKQQITIKGLEQLSEILKINLSRIEVFDNSHLAGTNNVSAMIVNQAGVFNKKEYRLYNLEKYKSDLDSFKEVLYRRYFRALKSLNTHPCDLLIVDGGYQQVKVAVEIRDSLKMDFVIIGLSKNDKHQTSKVIAEDGSIIEVDDKSEAFLFLTQLQDEVHRFVLAFQQKKRSKTLVFSMLDDCKGIGKVKKELLINEFKNIKDMQKASLTKLQDLVGEKSGIIVYEFLRSI